MELLSCFDPFNSSERSALERIADGYLVNDGFEGLMLFIARGVGNYLTSTQHP